jgi:hypothetical protein
MFLKSWKGERKDKRLKGQFIALKGGSAQAYFLLIKTS